MRKYIKNAVASLLLVVFLIFPPLLRVSPRPIRTAITRVSVASYVPLFQVREQPLTIRATTPTISLTTFLQVSFSAPCVPLRPVDTHIRLLITTVKTRLNKPTVKTKTARFYFFTPVFLRRHPATAAGTVSTFGPRALAVMKPAAPAQTCIIFVLRTIR